MPARWRLGAFYLAIFSLVGVQLPFWPAWLAARGLSPGEIGTVIAAGQWVKLATNPLAGMAADRGRSARPLMVALSLVALLGFWLFLPAHGFLTLLLLAALTGAALSALLPLGDHVALAAAYGGRLDYGRVRLWGSFGFIAAALVAGRLIGPWGSDSVVYLLIAGSAATFLACAGLPRAGAAPRQPRSDWRQLTRPALLLFFAAAALIQGSHAVYYGFGTLHWRRLGIADEVIAALWAEGVLAEILLFFWGTRLLGRFGPLGLLALGGGAGALRWAATCFASGVPLLVLLQLMHALSFGAAHLGAMHHLARRVPAAQAATGQVLYATLVGGLGQGLAMMLAGLLYGAWGAAAYLVMAVFAAAGAGLSGLAAATKS
jgi:PPP family 3-phenylpropionic acid transporter